MFWVQSLWLGVKRAWRDWCIQRAISCRNHAFHELEMSFVYDVAIRGRGCSQEWKVNHVRLAIKEQGIDPSTLGYVDERGKPEALNEDIWVARIVGLSECIPI